MSLEQFDFYDELSEDEKNILQNNVKPIELKEGVTLFYQGDVTEDILLLLEGEVRVYIQGEGINEITLYTLNPSEQCIVNTSSTINRIPTIGSAVTMTPVKALMINRDIIDDFMSHNNNYQKYIFSLLMLRLDSVARVLESVKFKQLDERLYEWIQGQNTKLVNITHEELANVVGSTRVVVSRNLKKLEKEGLIHLLRGKIELL